MSLRDELEKRACWYLENGWCSSYDYCLKKIAELDAKEAECYWGSERDCLERVNESEKRNPWLGYTVNGKIVDRREYYIHKRDEMARAGYSSLSFDWAQKLADLDAKEAKEKAERGGYVFNRIKVPSEAIKGGYFARMTRLGDEIKNEGDKMNDVFVHIKVVDHCHVSDCAAFEYAHNYKNALPNELGRIQTPRGACMRFLMDIVEVNEYVTTRKTTYKIMGS